ncbi:MAG TPA: hypothetical protein PJ995_21540 [Cyclobacteriaceae bacterium]|nr:hypothetical protein [Cyclobacteriaceae bacterium]HMX02935.1 hypothetical protein [Cyclobacteriaceae bacterium]
MNDFFESKFIKDLQEGKLPPVEVTVPNETLVKVFVGTFATVVSILIVAAIIKMLKK